MNFDDDMDEEDDSEEVKDSIDADMMRKQAVTGEYRPSMSVTDPQRLESLFSTPI